MLTFDMQSLAGELAIRLRRPVDIVDADYFLRRFRLIRFGETIGGQYVSEVIPTRMIENESRYFIATQVERAEEF